ncbi:MAG: SUMF1/EgtB/PvdO family nonheme iron enzyme [Roseomonas sp.]|nr:SUMF1/EgtB/PvdO family nonheme iron enzyme [Roseomonas sp.]
MTKTALIIGAQDYDPRDGLTPLSCARNDALALGRVLREQCGFGDVRVLAGEGIADSDGRPTKSAIRREINRLRESPKRIELLVVAFCAHGLTLPVGGADRYYLLPEDAHQHEPDSFLEFADLMRRLNEIPANDRAVIFDTCRNRPEAGRASGDNLLARDLSIELLTRPEDERKGTTAVLTACSLGERAYEMQDAGHGVFFHFLLQGMKGPAWTEQGTLSLNDAFGYAEREIAARKVFRQRPTFEQKGGGVILLGQREEPSTDLAFWQRVHNSTVAADFEAYLREFPTGRFVLLARQRLEELRQAKPPEPTPQPPRKPPLPAIVLGVVALTAVAGFALTRDKPPSPPVVTSAVRPSSPASGFPVSVGEFFRDAGCPGPCPEMVVIPAGRFLMGSPATEVGRGGNENAPFEVEVRAPFALGRHLVTVAEYQAFVDATRRADPPSCTGFRNGNWGHHEGLSWRNPGFEQTDRDPVVCVSWDDAKAYAEWLSARTGRGYGLPTEAQLEYAIRGGRQTRFWWGEDYAQQCAHANGWDETGRARVPGQSFVRGAPCADGFAFTSPVGRFRENGFRLSDAVGNAAQWSEDCYVANDLDAPRNAAVSRQLPGRCFERTVRGGSWVPSYNTLLTSARRGPLAPSRRKNDIGFRVVRTPGA